MADYFRPNPLMRDNQIVQPEEGFYTTDAFVDNAVKMIDGGDRSKPFFLYLAFNAPHYPLMAPEEEIARFRGKYKIGWDELRQRRYARQIELGIMEKRWALSPLPPSVRPWADVSPAEQERFDHIMSIYAAVVSHMDSAVGRLVASLKDRGLLDNTLVLFLSDNGANAESGPNGKLNGHPPGSVGSEVFEGQSWATLSNTPLRRYKHFNHEGGIATPLIVHWPQRVKTPGELRMQPGHIVDIMATCVDVAGACYPAGVQRQADPADGGQEPAARPEQSADPARRAILGARGQRRCPRGRLEVGPPRRRGSWELYDLAADRTRAAQPGRRQTGTGPQAGRQMGCMGGADSCETVSKGCREESCERRGAKFELIGCTCMRRGSMRCGLTVRD